MRFSACAARNSSSVSMSNASSHRAAWCAAMLFASTLTGCANRGTVVLLPEKDGKSTSVLVKENDRETVLDKPYAAVRQTPFGARAYTSTPEEVASKFGAALASQPQR